MPDGHHLVSQERLADLMEMAEDGAREGASFDIGCIEMVLILKHIETLQESLDAEGGFCEICGCTYHNPCEGGCSWVAPGLCSSCRYQVEPAEDDSDNGWQVRDLLEGEVLGDDKGSVIFMNREDAERAAREGRIRPDDIPDPDPLAEDNDDPVEDCREDDDCIDNFDYEHEDWDNGT